jgi:hypothetical protein
METLSDAITRLRGQGYSVDFAAVSGGSLRCTDCGADFEAAEMRIEEIVRFEGASDPGDEAILFALRGRCDHAGVYSAAYGPGATRADAEVAAGLGR